MSNFKSLKKKLTNNVKKLAGVCSVFCENPETDFIRKRKLDFETTMLSVLCMEGGALKDELLKINGYAPDVPTASAFIQARDKIKPDAFKALFDHFNTQTHKDKLYRGYRLIAIDGSELPIENFGKDKETYVIRHGKTLKPYSGFHINASYDLLECCYNDLVIQGEAVKDENDAFCIMVDRYRGAKAIFMADRNYESYNGFVHVMRSGNKFLIRVKDIDSKTSITRSLGPFPDGEFDIDVRRILTLKNTNEIKAHPEIYKFCPQNMRFDFMDKDNPFFEFECRVVRFKISDDSYECIITNLDRDEFSADEIKKLYNMRWGIETSFRELKYAADLNALHSKKRNLILQEIYARVILYNFTQRIIKDINIEGKRKHVYQINFTRAVHIVRNFLKEKGRKNLPVEDLIAKEILPIRPGGSHPRNVKPKTRVCFNYRFD